MASGGLEISALLRRLVNSKRQSDPQLPIILVIDQGEELLLRAGDEAGVEEREQFRKLLNDVLAQNQRVFIITTVRHELYDSFQYFWPTDITKRPFHLGPLSRKHYRPVIEEPLKLREFSSVRFSQVLVNKLVDDVTRQNADNPLPLLAFTLQRLYSKRKSNDVSHTAYEGLGEAIEAAGNEARFELKATFHGASNQSDAIDAMVDRDLSAFLFGHFLLIDQDGKASTRRCSRAEISEEREAPPWRPAPEGRVNAF